MFTVIKFPTSGSRVTTHAISIFVLLILSSAIFVACEGESGADGTQGATGAQGIQGEAGRTVHLAQKAIPVIQEPKVLLVKTVLLDLPDPAVTMENRVKPALLEVQLTSKQAMVYF